MRGFTLNFIFKWCLINKLMKCIALVSLNQYIRFNLICKSCDSSGQFKSLKLRLPNITLSLCNNFEVKLLPSVPIAKWEVERSAENLILLLHLTCFILVFVLYMNFFAMHHWDHLDLIFWLFSISAERSYFINAIALFVPLVPAFGEFEKMHFYWIFFLIEVEISIYHYSNKPFTLWIMNIL